jgi:hypothetical protein
VVPPLFRFWFKLDSRLRLPAADRRDDNKEKNVAILKSFTNLHELKLPYPHACHHCVVLDSFGLFSITFHRTAVIRRKISANQRFILQTLITLIILKELKVLNEPCPRESGDRFANYLIIKYFCQIL